ncbi:MAG: DUF3027 domain-containing protein [Actinomycetota bacterium]|jgi:hypothetical protein|nr:DUF3027 domain-containing protein [Actinomycetota bacterium]
MSSKVSATELALAALRETTETALIGEFVSEAETEKNVIEVRFSCTLNQYQHWHWVVTLTQADKRSPLTVSEINLLASADAQLAPQWVPWAERLAEFRRQLRAEGKANSDAEADALIEGMHSGFTNHEPGEDSKQNSDDGGVKPPVKTRVRQRRVKRQEDNQDQDPDSGSDQDS